MCEVEVAASTSCFVSRIGALVIVEDVRRLELKIQDEMCVAGDLLELLELGI